RVVARMAARPGVTLNEFQSVLEDESIEGLRADPMFWTYVEHGNVDAALNRMSFRRVAQNDALRRQLADLGLVEEEAALDSRVFGDAMGEVFREVGPRIRGLKNDPEVQELIQDPEIFAMIQSGDTLGLLRNPRFRGLVERVSSRSQAD
ncbi:MAG: hypothetical protein OEM49_15050, partial [Myxococcales bacterium]|nr:hypothetical protein [Myxococcales bacterium]